MISTRPRPDPNSPLPPVPTHPHPHAQAHEVQAFFREYFLASDNTMTEHEAKVKSEKLRVNGQYLYMMRPESFESAFSPEGRPIFEILASGPYSYIN